MSNTVWELPMQMRSAVTVPRRNLVMKTNQPRVEFHVITGNVTATLRPLTLCATGIVSDPTPDDPSSDIA